jgi:23S rRNA pseudouridine2604 synthase
MTFRNRLQYLLVKRLSISNKQALVLIIGGKVLVNQKIIVENITLNIEDEVSVGDVLVREGKKMLYIAFYKPRGIETTLNTAISANLKDILPFEESLFPVGRLDKESEGLLLLTNDGSVFDKTLRKEHHTQKQYIVTVDKPINDDFITKMSSGIQIMGQITLPCIVEKQTDFTCKITLIQGLNRQIRRMCYQLDYQVLLLKRISIGNIALDNLKPNEYRILTEKPI